MRQHDNHSSLAAQYFPLCKPKSGTEGWCAHRCAWGWTLATAGRGLSLSLICAQYCTRLESPSQQILRTTPTVLQAIQFAPLLTRLLPVEQQAEHSCGAETLQCYFISIIFPPSQSFIHFRQHHYDIQIIFLYIYFSL